VFPEQLSEPRLGTRVAHDSVMSAIDYQREVTPSWLAERTQHPLRVVDVREPFETIGEAGHIPGAERIPLNRLAASVAHWPRDSAIAIVDADGEQAARAATMLVNLDFIDVVWMAGGMRAWRAAGLPVAFTPEPEQVPAHLPR
jgi:rhodanese-related sulfurtransferase